MRVTRRERIERLWRHSVKQRVDGVCKRCLQARVGLKTKPSSVVHADVVVDASRLHLLMVIAGVRNTLPIRASVSVRGIA